MPNVQANKAETLLTTREAALYLRISKSWLDQGRSQGTGPAFHRVGGAIRYQKRDLDAWLVSCRVEPAQGAI